MTQRIYIHSNSLAVVIYFIHFSKLLLVLAMLSGLASKAQAMVIKQLYFSDPSQALDRIDPVASADETTAQSDLLGQQTVTWHTDDQTASLAAGNSINASTGELTYVASWAGTSVITASAAGYNGSSTSTHTVTNNAILAVNDTGTGQQGEPIIVNVVANDTGSVNPASVTIVTQPQNGSLQIGADGQIIYLPNGNFSGNDLYVYQVCSNTTPVVCDTATVSLSINPNLNDPCFEAPRAKTYYLPFPHNATQLRKALLSAASVNNLTNNARNIVSIKTAYPGTILTYDHWEDGYEADITVPTQSTTRVWGDGDLSNGVSPGYPTDIIPPGGYIILDDQFAYNPRVQTDIHFDGKDKLYSTTDMSVSVVTGDAGATGATVLMNVQNLKTNVFSTERFSKFFVLPFGEDVTLGSTSAFKYTSVFIRAAKDSTVVNLDYNGDGVTDLTQNLDEGEVWFYDGTASTPGVAGDINQANDIKAGAIITANFEVGIDLVFGGIDSYGTRNLALLPSSFVSNSYYNPVYTDLASAPVYIFFTNINESAITINWMNGSGGTGSISVPASGINYMNLPVAATGYKFESAGGESFTAVAVIDADATGATYDWAFPLIATERLTNSSSIAWAPGSNDLSGNYQPVWVTPTANTTLYIKFNGDLSTPTPTMSPCNIPYDLAISLNALQSYQIFDTDNDQTGLAIYTCDSTTFAAAWGEAPNAGAPTPTGSPAQDVGYVMEPKCLEQLIIANDDKEITSPSTPVIIGILENDFGFLCTLDPNSVSTSGLLPPSNGTIMVNNNSTITYLPNSGFEGTDVFEYRVCSVEYPDVCDVATVTVMVGDCMFIPDKNQIIGKVIVEQLPDDGIFNGEQPAGNVQVDLYIDVDCDGTVDAGVDNVMASTVSNLSGRFSFNIFNEYNAKDDFDPTASFSGNDGGINWTTNWVEQGDNNIINTGDVQIITDNSSGGFGNAIRIAGPNNGISRSLTFSNATAATLKFMYRRENFNNGGEQLLIQVNGSTVYVINDGDYVPTDPNYKEVEINLTSFNANGSNTVQFITNGTPATNEYFWVDNVELKYRQSNTCYIAKVNPSNTGGYYLPAILEKQSISFTDTGNCSNLNYLAVFATMVAHDDDVNTSTDVPVIVSVLDNDTPGFADPSTVTTIGMTNQPANGTVSVNSDGTITYTPSPGFTGTDDFEYQVCSIEDPALCDTALVTVIVSCVNIPLQNTVTGIVYKDVNLNGSQEIGENGLSGVDVNLYKDENSSGTLDGGDLLLATEATSSLGTYQFDITPPTTTSTYLDQFNANTTANQSHGTTSWTSQSWTEIGTTNGFATAPIRILSSNGLVIEGNGTANVLGARRTADISNAVSATLSFSFNESGLELDVNDYVDVEIATSASPASWTLLKRFTGANGNQTGTESFNITPYISATTTIRFVTSGSAGMATSDIVYFDNVQISYTVPSAAAYIIQLTQPIPTGYTLTTPLPNPTGIHTASFMGAGAGDCQNNFGLAGADLSITKTDSPDPVVAGQNLTYTIQVNNNGPTDATSVLVNDVLPASLSVISATPSMGTWTAPNWTIDTLANGQSANLVIVATVSINTTPGTAVFSNTATVSSTTTDPVAGNNSSTAETDVICQSVAAATGSNSPVCESDILSLSENGGDAVSWSWEGPNGFLSTDQNPVIDPVQLAASGTYTVTVTASNGCTAVVTTSVTVNALPTATAGNTGPYCAGQTVSLSSSGGVSYAWTGPDGFTSASQNPTINNATVDATGTYTAVVTGSNGCTDSETTVVTVYDSPAVSGTPTSPTCAGDTDGSISLNITGGTGPFDYNWDNGSTTGSGTGNSISGLSGGTYQITVTDDNGCTATTTVIVAEPATLTATGTGTEPTSSGGSDGSITLNIQNGTANYDITWTGTSSGSDTATSAGDFTINSLSSGNYNFTITDANGCTTTVTVAVPVFACPPIKGMINGSKS